jgi:hypothetical protein
MDWAAVMRREGSSVDGIAKGFADLKARPQWGEFARQAAVEEFSAGAGDIDGAVGRVLARHLTLGELQAGDALLRGPAGDSLAQAAADAAAGRTPAEPTPDAKAALQRALSTADGAAFIAKIGRIETDMPEAQQAAGAAAALGWMRRFCDKAASAEPPASADPDEAERLGGRLTTLLFQKVDFGAEMQKALGPQLERSFAFAPGWPDLMHAALAEAFAADSGALQRAGGKVFGRYFTVDELRAGVEALNGPDGVAFSEALAQSLGGGPPPSSAALQPIAMKLQRTPAGLAFLKKLGAAGDAGKTMGEEYGAVVLLAAMRRFIDKAEVAPPLAG